MLLWHVGVLLALGVSVQGQGCIRILESDTCPAGYRCVEGQCRNDGGQPDRCSRGMPCPNPTHTCQQGICVPTRPSGCLGCEFHPDVICENDRCVRRPGARCGGQFEPCSSGYSCIRGVCSSRGQGQCFSDRDCSPNERCSQRMCVPRTVEQQCRYERDCSINERCIQGRCIPNVGSPECRRDSDCLTGACRGGYCVEAMKNMFRVWRHKTIQPVESCNPYRNRLCSRGYRCVNNQCVPNEEPECGPTRPCQLGYQCRMGTCVEGQTPGPTRCRSDRQCQSGYQCVRRRCQPRYLP